MSLLQEVVALLIILTMIFGTYGFVYYVESAI